MIIVSQNKEMILNFNMISYLSIGENHKGSINKKDFKYSIYADNVKNIGDYPTLDRAKEVLKEIYTFKTHTIAMSNEGITSEIKEHYEMPQE